MATNQLLFRYTRSLAALAEGVTFTVEWSDSLPGDPWSSVGVVDSIDPDNSGDGMVENRVATVPMGLEGKRFVRLRVTRP